MKLSTLKTTCILALATIALSACTHDIYRQNYGYNWRAYQAPKEATDVAGSPTALPRPILETTQSTSAPLPDIMAAPTPAPATTPAPRKKAKKAKK